MLLSTAASRAIAALRPCVRVPQQRVPRHHGRLCATAARPVVQDVLSDDCDGLQYVLGKIDPDRSCHDVNSPRGVSDPSAAELKFVDFVLNHKPSEKALWRAKVAIADTCSVAAAGEGFPSAEIMKRYALQEHGGTGGKQLFGAGETSRTGAAFAFAQAGPRFVACAVPLQLPGRDSGDC